MASSPKGGPGSLQQELQSLQSNYSPSLTREEALKYATQAAELYLKFLRLATNKTEKTELSKKCKSFLDEAERIKASENWTPSDELLIDLKPLGTHDSHSTDFTSSPLTNEARQAAYTLPISFPLPERETLSKLSEPIASRNTSKEERAILTKSSQVNGAIFPQWNDSELHNTFTKVHGGAIFSDSFEMRMSTEQLEIFDAWKRPVEALPPPSWPAPAPENSRLQHNEVFMRAHNVVDLVQDAATDCSIVASLSAGIARTEHGFPEILATAVHPFDIAAGHPRLSPCGLYIVRLNFNGCYRQVIIDDRLPVSNTSRILHVVDRNNPSLLWPALLEKAYLKVRGGYDFPGSNSGTDLWVLTGWIPEQIFLQGPDVELEKLWSRVCKSFGYGDVLVTLGTGVMTEQTEHDLGLAGEHDYAVIDMSDLRGKKRLLVKNPWLKATAWKDYHLGAEDSEVQTDDGSSADNMTWATAPSHYSASTESADTPVATSDEEALSPGLFWMDFSDVLQNFDSIYLNWNPTLFKYRQDVHFNWNLVPGPLNSRSISGSFHSNPQFTIKCSKKDHVWLVLSRHFTDSSSEYSGRGSQGYISLYAFNNGGMRCFMSKGSLKQTPYVDSPQTLLSTEMEPHINYTLVVSEQDLPDSQHTFTLSAFSRVPLVLETAHPRFLQHSIMRSSWTHANAGGNASSPRYSQNPQFALRVNEPSVFCISLETLTPSLRVHAKLLHGQGQRVYTVTNRDIVVDTGDYRRGCALAETRTPVDKGTYTIICSTFESDQFGDFTLRVYSDVATTLTTIPREGAGQIRQRLADASFGPGLMSIAAPVVPQRLASISFTARFVPSAVWQPVDDLGHDQQQHSLIRITLEGGRGPERAILVSSGVGEYDYSHGATRTEAVTVGPKQTAKSALWLVLQRRAVPGSLGQGEERVGVDMFTDAVDAIGIGVWRDWD